MRLYEYLLEHQIKKEDLLEEFSLQWLVSTPLYNIGEHVYNLSSEYKEVHNEIQWAMIAGLRHRLVHDYDGTNWNIIADVVFEELPILINQFRRILNFSPDVKREFKKLYIAYKLDTNFVDIVIQKQRLRISVNMKFSEVYDPIGTCCDITGLGRWGNGDVELFSEHTSDVDQVMEIIEQAYRQQVDE